MKATTPLSLLEVELAGAPLSESDANLLAVITVRQRLSMPAQLELTFRGADNELADRAALLVGLSVAVRGNPDRTTLFQGDVTAAELSYGPDAGLEVRIRAYDPLHRLRKRQSLRGFVELDAGELARQLTEATGLTVNESDSGPPRRQILQWHQSDLALLSDVTQSAGLYFVATDGSLELLSLGGGGGEGIDLRLGDDLFEATFEINGDDAIESVATVGWDPNTGQRFEESVTEPRSARTAGAYVPVGDLGGEPERTLTNVVAGDAADARAVAQGALDRAMASRIVLRGVAAGHAEVRPGATVRVAGVALAFSGDYQVTEAVHVMDTDHGYLTSFSTAPPPPLASEVPLVAPAIVERLDDPDGRGRVKVSFPTMRSVESEWFRVVLPAVGHRSGLVALPRKGDEVLVLFPSGDPAAGVVLGGLYSGDDPPEFGVVDGEVRRYTWRTREGQRIELDEANDRIRLAIPNGSAVTLGRKQLTIHSATDLEISAPGKTIAIKAKAVDFQKTES